MNRIGYHESEYHNALIHIIMCEMNSNVCVGMDKKKCLTVVDGSTTIVVDSKVEIRGIPG